MRCMRERRKGSRFVRKRMATGFGGGILFSAVMMATARDDGEGRRCGSKPHFSPFSHLLTFVLATLKFIYLFLILFDAFLSQLLLTGNECTRDGRCVKIIYLFMLNAGSCTFPSLLLY
ncbi:hypothetical protein E2542_SST08849 [Spatholobus suberectus]|nr:hypothetical protein E2542_SST08849 [Spatholobus suberectus]